MMFHDSTALDALFWRLLKLDCPKARLHVHECEFDTNRGVQKMPVYRPYKRDFGHL